MKLTSDFDRGLRFLKSYLAKNKTDIATTDCTGFREWLQWQLQRKNNDFVFQLRSQARDLRKKHILQLTELRTSWRKAKELFAKKYGEDLDFFQKDLHNAQKAMEGLKQAIAKSPQDKANALQEKWNVFQQKEKELLEKMEIIHQSQEHKNLVKAEETLASFRREIGLEQVEQELKEGQNQLAKRLTSSGSSFETLCQNIVQEKVTRHVLRLSQSAAIPSNIRVLSSVRIGTSKAELDFVVVRCSEKKGKVVQVLAVVEAKRDANDISHGFYMRQENLAFFTHSATGYLASEYRTQTFPTGHFTNESVHTENGEEYRFGPSSFSLFKKEENGSFLKRLFFLTDQRPLSGLNSSESSRLFYRISNDLDFSLEDENYLQDLLDYLKQTIKTEQTLHVLQKYQINSWMAQHIFFLQRQKKIALASE